uniref:hypothetical protein n=1 Tax=Agathobacter sp. TaxID=2021311 RepID=UPI004056759D
MNAFYYACSYAKVDYSGFMNVTASMALKLIPNSLLSQPVFLCVDDTMVAKFGKKFEQVSVLFDHAASCVWQSINDCRKTNRTYRSRISASETDCETNRTTGSKMKSL